MKCNIIPRLALQNTYMDVMSFVSLAEGLHYQKTRHIGLRWISLRVESCKTSTWVYNFPRKARFNL